MAAAFLAPAPALRADAAPALQPARQLPVVAGLADGRPAASNTSLPSATVGLAAVGCAVLAAAPRRLRRTRAAAAASQRPARTARASGSQPAGDAVAARLQAVPEADAGSQPKAASSPESVTVEPDLLSLSQLTQLRAVPFLPEPAYRRFARNVPGDAGFDPLGLAGSNPRSFVNMLDAETKHGRLAMLAGVGFVAPELLHARFAKILGLPNLMADGGCVPTVLNGGLENSVLLGSLAAFFAVVGFAELIAPRGTGLPGYYGFDPMGFSNVQFSKLARSMLRSDVEWVAEAETKHGRIAMVAVTYMAFREFLSGAPTWPSL
mmetsp:Transcript_60835/g.188943  ORF Transcript_60835/g.188943 Transcript_60835/m.188943 type:complete len:321 (+) Transcript_60835:41-1003(+)